MNRIIYFILLGIVIALTSCEDKDESGYGAPVISSIKHSVRVTETIDGKSVDAMKDQEIQDGRLGDWIFIDGSNFYNVQKIIFNDDTVNVSSAYVTPNRISISIPRYAPKEISNKVQVITAYGTAVKDFPINVPPLIITGLQNEYVEPGEIAYIIGDNFDIYQIDTLGGAWVELAGKRVKLTMDNSKKLSFRVPEDAQPNSEVVIYRKDKDGVLTVNRKLSGRYRDKRNIILTMNDGEGWDDVERTEGFKYGYPDSIAGKYAAFKGDYTIAWEWHAKWFWSADSPVKNAFDNFENYLGPVGNLHVVFETNVLRDWVGTPMTIVVFDHEYIWEPYKGMSYRTNGWRTIRIPITEFKQGGKPLSEITSSMMTDKRLRRLMFRGATLGNIFICIDNIRVIPINTLD